MNRRGRQHGRFGSTAWRTAAARAVVVLVLVAATAVTVPAGRAEPGGCGWTTAGSGGPVAGAFDPVFPEADETHLNVLFGELDAHYWQSFERIPTGGYIEYHGEFPHARFMSFTNYGGGIRSVDGIHDAAIVADPGSTNPYLPGADRTAEPRWFTVRFVDGQAPPADQRPPNTFYRINEDGSNESRRLAPTVTLRIYTPDRGTGVTGGVALPQISVVDAEGNRTELGPCPDGGLPDAGYDEVLANAGVGEQLPANEVGDNPPVWRKFTGYGSAATGGDSATGSGGFGDNHEQSYLHTQYSQHQGEVLVIRAKAPTFVPTWDAVPVMGEGQLRFWTMCTYSETTNGYACRRDETVPLDAEGFYTYVVSTAASRPSNATDQCGVAWLPAGGATVARVILRNLLPAPEFAEAIHNVEFGREVEMMGDYYPHATYQSAREFEQRGCAPPDTSKGKEPKDKPKNPKAQDDR